MNSSRVNSPFSIGSFARASVCARLETRSSYRVTVFYLVLPLSSSLNHPVRSLQDVRRDRQADLHCRFQIDDELEFRRLFHWEISGLSALQNLVHVRSGTPEQVGKARAVGQSPPAYTHSAM